MFFSIVKQLSPTKTKVPAAEKQLTFLLRVLDLFYFSFVLRELQFLQQFEQHPEHPLPSFFCLLIESTASTTHIARTTIIITSYIFILIHCVKCYKIHFVFEYCFCLHIFVNNSYLIRFI